MYVKVESWTSSEVEPTTSPVNLPGIRIHPALDTPADHHTKHVPDPDPSNVHGMQRTAIFIQDECLQHRYIRSRDTSDIYERPERLHAVKLGLAAAIARIEGAEPVTSVEALPLAHTTSADEGDLAAAMARMTIAPATAPALGTQLRTASVTIRRTSASVRLLDHAAVKYVHGDIEGDVYLENLITWARDSRENIAKNEREIPEGMPLGDLYLCPGSIDAIQGAVGAVCEAVDGSVTATRGPRPPQVPRGPDDPCERAFVAIRPPGHHCGEDTPSGFCFINNVAVGAAHAHLKHGMQRIVILDIDLHHGNGTQSIVWQINDETYQKTLGSESPLDDDVLPANQGPRVFYGSIHDILSFPCEDGKPEMVQAASTSIHGAHGQYIENIHLQKYDSEAHFWAVLYPRYLSLLHRARDFLDETGGPGNDAIIFISCGFDAGEHEFPSMSRHNRRVPVGFYHRFTRETCELANEYAGGRLVSVLEGGYSDRALTSGAIAHLCGLVNVVSQSTSGYHSDGWVDPSWWSESNLIKLEKASKFRKAVSSRAGADEWIARAIGVLSVLNGDSSVKPTSSRSAKAGANAGTSTSAASMTLRERKKPVLDGAREGNAAPNAAPTGKNAGRSVSMPAAQCLERTGATATKDTTSGAPSAGVSGPESGCEALSQGAERKKLPRVILRVRPPDEA